MRKFQKVVIGGGAAGIVAAISAKRSGQDVLVCERMPRIGKKILASGNGRCNLSNEEIGECCFNPSARDLVKSIFEIFDGSKIIKFFEGLGLRTYSQDGRLFPVTNQSSSVLKVLEIELRRLSIPVGLGFEAKDISVSNGLFRITSSSGMRMDAGSIILAGGGKAYPALGSDGSAMRIAKSLGHSIVKPVPAAVPLVVKSRLCHALQGQKISASLSGFVGKNEVCHSTGDLLFTEYGISGSAVLDLGDDISVAINRSENLDVRVIADLAPFINASELEKIIAGRVGSNYKRAELLCGILPEKFGAALRDSILCESPAGIASKIKSMEFEISGTRGWNEGEFTAGGVNTGEVDHHTLESMIVKGLYICGEMLDVNGKRGGYNLAWAWASGFVAGSNHTKGL